jgi:hypothetical protein
MEPSSLTPYEAEQVARIAAWKGRRPGLVGRSIDVIKRPLDWLFEKVVPGTEARRMLARLHRSADWQHGRDRIQEALGIQDLKDLYHGPLERCDALVGKVKELSREIITSESLLGNLGGLATELLELPAELLLALRTVHRVAGCYGYRLVAPADDTLVLAIIGVSLLDMPDERVQACRFLRELEEGKGRREDQDQLAAISQSRIEDEVAGELASTLLEEKLSEAIPLLGAAIGVVLDNAFLAEIEEAAERVFQERWLRAHGKIDEIAPARGEHSGSNALGAGLNHAVYSTSYAISFGVVFPVALLAQAGVAVLPSRLTRGVKDGADGASRDVGRLTGDSHDPRVVPTS